MAPEADTDTAGSRWKDGFIAVNRLGEGVRGDRGQAGLEENTEVVA